MGWKENLAQAGKELMDGKLTVEPAAPDQEAKPVVAAKPAANKGRPADVQPEPAVKKQKTVIARGTTIVGGIQAEGDLELYGTVQGDITGKGNLRLQGDITGDVVGHNIDLCAIKMKGNLTAENLIQIDHDSVLEGDVIGRSLIVDGQINGNVKISGSLCMQDNASIIGSVEASKLSVAEGAVIQGSIHIIREKK